MKNYQNPLLPYCRLCILLLHRTFDVFFWVNIGWDMLIHISYYSYLVSWRTFNSRKMALAPENGELPQYYSPILYIMDAIFSYIIWCFYGWILVQLHQFLFLLTQIHCLGDQKIVVRWKNLRKYEELPQYYSTIL